MGSTVGSLATRLLAVATGHLDRDDLVQVAFLLLVAGNATVASMIGLVNRLVPEEARGVLLTYAALFRGW